MKKSILGMLLALALVLTACGGDEPAESTDASVDTSVEETTETVETTEEAAGEAEVLTGEAEGRNGPIKVEVTVEGDTITKVEVVEHEETEGIADPALTDTPAAIVENNGTEGVDAAAGATMTHDAIIEAVNNALENR